MNESEAPVNDYVNTIYASEAALLRIKIDQPQLAIVDNAVAAMKNGADDYLAKPFKRDELLNEEISS